MVKCVIKTSIDFWCRKELNFKFLIQLSEILSVEQTGTHKYVVITSIIFVTKKSPLFIYRSD